MIIKVKEIMSHYRRDRVKYSDDGCLLQVNSSYILEINLPLPSKNGSQQIRSYESPFMTEDSSYECRNIWIRYLISYSDWSHNQL
jgi:hypothetical protein